MVKDNNICGAHEQDGHAHGYVQTCKTAVTHSKGQSGSSPSQLTTTTSSHPLLLMDTAAPAQQQSLLRFRQIIKVCLMQTGQQHLAAQLLLQSTGEVAVKT